MIKNLIAFPCNRGGVGGGGVVGGVERVLLWPVKQPWGVREQLRRYAFTSVSVLTVHYDANPSPLSVFKCKHILYGSLFACDDLGN